LDQFSPRQSRPHFKIASIAAASASQSKDRNDKQKTGFFDSIDPKGDLRRRMAKSKVDALFCPDFSAKNPSFFQLVGLGSQFLPQ
jgi:hypothetical protein